MTLIYYQLMEKIIQYCMRIGIRAGKLCICDCNAACDSSCNTEKS